MDKLAISFSGGRTSAVMTDVLLKKFPDKEIEITFANTGLEHPDTLRFVSDCDRNLFGGKVVWLEAVVDPEHGKGIRHKIVSFETAARNGEPYRDAVEKYGLFNPTSPSCTARTKVEPMESYLKTKGFFRGKKLNYETAIGIRADEIDRISEMHKKQGLIYPLADLGYRKRDVKEYCRKWDFDLKIPEHYGNCVGCWKKTFRKLATVSKEIPASFNFWRKIESDFKSVKTENNHDPDTGYRRIFRDQKTVDDIFQIADRPDFKPYRDIDDQQSEFGWMDLGGSCGDSCEIYSDEN